MGITTSVFVAAMALGSLTGYVTAVGARGGITTVPMARACLGALSTLMLFSLLIWGFASLSWYWPIVAFVGGGLLTGMLVSRVTWPMLFLIQPSLDLAFIGLGLYLWVWHWPFG